MTLEEFEKHIKWLGEEGVSCSPHPTLTNAYIAVLQDGCVEYDCDSKTWRIITERSVRTGSSLRKALLS